jgi:hypothetical protein
MGWRKKAVVKKGQGEQDTPEERLAAAVSSWLIAEGWKVYPEVQLSRSGDRADLVAVRPKIKVAWVIACKTSFGFAVLEQAWRWTMYANWVSVAIPAVKRRGFKKIGSRIGAVATRCLRSEGIGVLRVDKDDRVTEDLSARFNRIGVRHHDLLDECSPDHQRMGVAGSKHQFYTPFRATREAAERFVVEHPHCTVKELLANIDYHWRTENTARTCVLKYIARGVFGRIAVEPGSRPFRLVTPSI